MKTKTHTSNGADRYLVLMVDDLETLADVERFAGSSYKVGEEDQPMVKTPDGDIPIHVTDRIVFTGGTMQSEFEIGGKLYSQPYIVFNETEFDEVFSGVHLGR